MKPSIANGYHIVHDPDIDFLYITGPRGEHVAVIAGPLSQEDHERARLFAAAPELLRLAHRTVGMIGALVADDRLPQYTVPWGEDVAAPYWAAINAATGAQV